MKPIETIENKFRTYFQQYISDTRSVWYQSAVFLSEINDSGIYYMKQCSPANIKMIRVHR